MMSRHLAWALPALCAATLLGACGGKSFGPGEGDDGGSGGSSYAGNGSGAEDTGGSGIAGSGVAGTAVGGSSSTGGSSSAGMGAGGKQSCSIAAYEDEPPGSVPVRLINATKNPIYLGDEMPGCASGPQFQVFDARGGQLPAVSYCQPSCEQLLTGNIVGCPAIACAISSVITLQPGESALTLWSAIYSQHVVLPPACSARAGQKECERITGVTPGTYIFTAQAGTGMECLNNGAGSCGSCMESGNGGCTTYGAVITGPLLQAKIDVQLDGSYGIGGPGGGGMVRSVDIIFQ